MDSGPGLLSFTLDRVFNVNSTQEEVYEFSARPVIESVLEGFNGTVLAYGQTSSGKTYTMMGNPDLDDQKGMIPRSLEQIFQASQALKSQGWKYYAGLDVGNLQRDYKGLACCKSHGCSRWWFFKVHNQA